MTLSAGTLDELFPFNLRLGGDGTVASVGPSLRKVAPHLTVGERPDAERLQVQRPVGLAFESEALRDAIGALLIIKLLPSGLLLRGQCVAETDGTLLLAASPWIVDLKQLRQHDLGMRDFALQDPVADLLGLLQAKNATLSEAREVTKRLRQGRAELVRARLAAEAGSEAKSRFLATMSHEIRTPLNAIIGFLELLCDSTMSEEQGEFATTAFEASTSLLALVNDALDFSKVEAGKLSIESIPFDLDALLGNLAGTFAVLAGKKQLDFRVERPGEDTWRLGDPTRVRQLLSNLIGNAIKFTTTGSVRVDASVEGSIARFRIEDTGRGIPPYQLESIFEPFVQAEEVTTRQYGGTGLGLAICKRLTEAMGGQIQVASTIDEGTRFDVDLPLDKATAPRPTDGDERTSKDLEGLRVLVVDDVKVNRRLLDVMLTRHGADVTLADDGFEAVEHCRNASFDLILLDMFMPGLSGLDTLDECRRLNAIDGARIIVLTADATPEMRERAISARIDGFATKPIRPSKLLSAIHDALREPVEPTS